MVNFTGCERLDCRGVASGSGNANDPFWRKSKFTVKIRYTEKNLEIDRENPGL
jgi:hypothetical protein